MFPILTLLATLISVLASVYALNVFALLFLAIKRLLHHDLSKRDSDPTKNENWPPVTIQIPVYNENSIVENLIRNITSLDYPKEKLQIQILDDSTDGVTLQNEKRLIREYKPEGYDIQLIHRESRQGYKAGALNNGLESAKGEFIAIMDADTVLPERFVKELISDFRQDEKLAFIQSKCDYTDRWFNWITEADAVSKDIHFLIEQPAKDRYNLLPNFCGKAGMWRRKVLEKYRWDEKVITEDVELSYRVQIDGWKAIYHLNPTCFIELPPHLTEMKTQQKRWTAGITQTFRKLWKKIIFSNNLTLSQKVETFMLLSAPATHLFALAAIIVWVLAAILEPTVTLDLWLGTKTVSIFIALASAGPLLASIATAFLHDKKEKIVRKILTAYLSLILITANLITNAKGVLLGIFKNDLTFEKTMKYGIKHNTEKHQVRTDLGVGRLIKNNIIEFISSILIAFAILYVGLRGQITTVIPLSFILLAFLVSVFQK